MSFPLDVNVQWWSGMVLCVLKSSGQALLITKRGLILASYGSYFQVQTDCKTTLAALSPKTRAALVEKQWLSFCVGRVSDSLSVFSLWTPLPSLSPLSICADIKTDVKCTRYTLYLRQIIASCVWTREFVLERRDIANICVLCVSSSLRSPCDSKRQRGKPAKK